MKLTFYYCYGLEFEVRKNMSDIKRRVSFKAGAPSGRNGYNKNNRISEVSVRAHLEDDDDMGGEQNKVCSI